MLDRGYLGGSTLLVYDASEKREAMWQVRERVSGTRILLRMVPCAKEEAVNVL